MHRPLAYVCLLNKTINIKSHIIYFYYHYHYYYYYYYFYFSSLNCTVFCSPLFPYEPTCYFLFTSFSFNFSVDFPLSDFYCSLYVCVCLCVLIFFSALTIWSGCFHNSCFILFFFFFSAVNWLMQAFVFKFCIIIINITNSHIYLSTSFII